MLLGHQSTFGGDMSNHRSVRAHKKASDIAEVLRACAHPHRLLLLCLLEHEPWSVGSLAAETGLSQPAVSQHLARLRKASLVVASRSSNMMYYCLDGAHSSGGLKALIGTFCEELARNTKHGR